jgi:hypothetical protein
VAFTTVTGTTDPSDFSPSPLTSARALAFGFGCHPIRARSPVFNVHPSQRAVPATPGEQTGALADSCRSILPSPLLQGLGLTNFLYEATSRFTHVRPAASQPQDAPCDVLVPLLPGTSRHHAGDLASQLSTFPRVGLLSFHG